MIIKQKQIFRRTLSLLMAVLICIMGIPLTAFAYTVNVAGLLGAPGSAYVEGYGSWHTPDYGARESL